MNPISFYAALALTIIALLFGAVGGYWVADYFAARKIENLNKQLTQAKVDTSVAVAAVDSTRTALGALKDKYAELQTRHEAMRTLSETELAARDSRIDRLKAAAARRQEAIVEKAHEPDCADLEHLPLCPAIADQLWPPATESAGRDASGSH